MAVKIVTDSTSDISQETARKLGITVVPLWVHFGDQAYRDGIDLYPPEFFSRLAGDKLFPTTSAPSPQVFAEAYDRLAEETDEVLTLTISSKYSLTHEAATKGQELRKRKDCRVEVIDTTTTIAGQGLLVMIAAEEAERGANLDQIMDAVRQSMPKTHTRVCFNTLEYLRRGGRIGTAQALMGSLLRVHPIIGIINGYTEGIARARSRTKGIEWLCNFIKGFNNIRELAVEYATTPDEAEELAQRLDSVFPVENIRRFTFGPVVGAHVGPHAIGVALVEQG
jgi:DegV family protein with EDD domain